jgi:hypothetical protein
VKPDQKSLTIGFHESLTFLHGYVFMANLRMFIYEDVARYQKFSLKEEVCLAFHINKYSVYFGKVVGKAFFTSRF